MKRWLLAAMLPVLIAATGPSGEPPQRIKLQKEWLKTLGYFDEAVSTADTEAYRSARREFAADVGASAAPALFHKELKKAFERNQRARGTCRGSRGAATACLQKFNQ